MMMRYKGQFLICLPVSIFSLLIIMVFNKAVNSYIWIYLFMPLIMFNKDGDF